MKFDVIVGNPPYQLSDGGNGASARPIYHLFVEQVIKLNPRYIAMIIPARWYAGGKGLETFRSNMLNDNRISQLVDIPNSADCFPGVNIAGGVCYFLWEREWSDKCTVSNLTDGKLISTSRRSLNEFPFFIRNNQSVSIVEKVLRGRRPLSETVYARNYFKVPTTVEDNSQLQAARIETLTSKGWIKLARDQISDSKDILNDFKVVITYAMSGGNKPSSSGTYQVISSLLILDPGQACSETYLILAVFKSHGDATRFRDYVASKVFRFLLLQALTSIHITKDKFCFVPELDLSIHENDNCFYNYFDLTQSEIDLIENTISPLEVE